MIGYEAMDIAWSNNVWLQNLCLEVPTKCNAMVIGYVFLILILKLNIKWRVEPPPPLSVFLQVPLEAFRGEAASFWINYQAKLILIIIEVGKFL